MNAGVGRPRVSTAVGLLLAAVGFSITARLTADNSLLTHVATGRLILDSGSVPTADPYSAHFAGQPWTVQSWLSSVIYAAIVELGGFSWLRVVHGFVGLGLVLGFWRLTATARHLVVRCGLTVGFLVIGQAFWSPRPLLFGLAGLLIVVLVLEGHVRAPWLVPVMWIWVNSHGSFPLALVLWGATVAGMMVDRWLEVGGNQTPTSQTDRFRQALGLTPRSVLAAGLWIGVGTVLGAASPLGPRLLFFPFATVSRQDALDRVVEWQPPTFTSPAELLYLALVGCVALAARRPGFGWRYLIPALLFLASGFLAVRNIAPGSLVVLALLTRGFAADPAPSGADDRTIDRSVAFGQRRSGPALLAAVGGAALVLTLTVMAATEPGVNLDRYPVAAVDYLDERGLVAEPDVSLVHREAVGNYLTYRYGENASVYMDDRFDFYPVDRTSDHLDLVYGGPYNQVLSKVDATVVLWQSDSLLADWLRESDGWSMAFEDDEWLVACRRATSTFDRCMD